MNFGAKGRQLAQAGAVLFASAAAIAKLDAQGMSVVRDGSDPFFAGTIQILLPELDSLQQAPRFLVLMQFPSKYLTLMRQTFGRISLSFELLDSGSNQRTPKSKLKRITHLEWIPQQMREFYAESNGQSFEWKTPAGDSSRRACQGRLNLLPLEKAYRDWKGIVYFDFTENTRLQHFKIIDYFADEACVGIFHDEQQAPGLYYYYLGENDGLYPLYLNLDGYLTLLTKSLG